MRQTIVAMLVALTLTACSQVTQQVVTIARNDFTRTMEIADKYGKPEVKQCFAFLLTALDKADKDQASLDALLAEDTDGPASVALKIVLVKEYLSSLNDSAKQAQFEKDFDENCSKTAGKIFLNMIRDARTIGLKGR